MYYEFRVQLKCRGFINIPLHSIIFSSNRMARKMMLLTFYFLLALCLMGLGEAKFRRPRKRDFEEIGGDFEWEEIGGGGVSIYLFTE